jgi:hypothetical protein
MGRSAMRFRFPFEGAGTAPPEAVGGDMRPDLRRDFPKDLR